jgi:hypothetical protein
MDLRSEEKTNLEEIIEKISETWKEIKKISNGYKKIIYPL